jgi:hypothetical protein
MTSQAMQTDHVHRDRRSGNQRDAAARAACICSGRRSELGAKVVPGFHKTSERANPQVKRSDQIMNMAPSLSARAEWAPCTRRV